MNHELLGKMKYKDEAWHGRATMPGFPSGPAAPLPVLILDPTKDGPTPQQEKAAQHLLAQPADVMHGVAEGLFTSYQGAYAQEDWRETCGLTPAKSLADVEEYELREVQIQQEHHKGVSFLVFLFDAAWGNDGDMYIVYHPNKAPAWTNPAHLIDVLESDEPVGGKDFVPSPSQELVDAILIGDKEKADKLIAAGMDINALAPDEPPPLWIAAHQMQPELVRRLLAYGADPALKCPQEKTTPLQQAKNMYREMGFAPSKKKDPMADIMKEAMRGAAGQAFAIVQAQLEEIISLLEAAGSKKS